MITQIELSPLEREIDELLQKSNFYLQTYRAIDAQNVLQQAQILMDKGEVQWPVKTAVLRNLGQVQIQLGNMQEGIRCFEQSYECIEDGNDKAAAAGMIAGYYLREGDNGKALEFAEKALKTVIAPELRAMPYQIQGGVADREGNYPKAIEMFNRAAELAEEAHCLTDVAMYIMDLSAVYMKMDMPETALSEIYRAERYVKECRNLDLYMRCAIRRAKILYLMGKDDEAKRLIMALDEQKN